MIGPPVVAVTTAEQSVLASSGIVFTHTLNRDPAATVYVFTTGAPLGSRKRTSTSAAVVPGFWIR